MTSEIAAGRLEATVAGGDWLSVTSLRFDGVELLGAPDDLPLPYRVHGHRAGITLLHPWANRLGGDRYRCAGVDVALDDPGARGVERDPGGLPIHGLRIPGAWRVECDAADASACRAKGRFDAQPAFPFPHTVAVEFRLVAAGELAVRTTVSATGDRAVPVSFGWHPYFIADRDAGGVWVELPERAAVPLDDRGVPTGGPGEPRTAERLVLVSQSFDDAFAEVADGAAFVLGGPERTLRLVHDSGYPCGQLFAPADRPVVSLEPMTAPGDALRSSAVGLVAPGASFTARWTLHIRSTDQAAAAAT